MGLFDMFTGADGKSAFGAHEGFAGILLAAAAADGHIADEEARGLWSAIERMKLFSSYTPDKFSKLMDTLLKVLKKGGPDALVEKCVPALPERLRSTAFCNAVDIVLADGTVEDEEKELIEKLQTALGVSDNDAKTIINVMIVKNRG
jgi:tellurite resistance protein